MKKIVRLLLIVLMLLINLLITSCAAKTVEINTAVEVSIEEAPAINIEDGVQDKTAEANKIAGRTFTAQKVSGLSAMDARSFGAAMQEAGWSPMVTCLGNYCDIGTRGHFETAATIVFLSGHGYVEDSNGLFLYSVLDQKIHEQVLRAGENTESYSFNNQSVWSEMEKFYEVVSNQQKQVTDWLVISACNQLRADTRVSIFEAMSEPSDRPLKGVLGYSSFQGSSRDDLIMKKFVELCLNGKGKERVAHAWFAAHEVYDPSLSPRVRVALRDGFKDDTLTSEGASSEDFDNRIRLWWMTRGDLILQPNADIPEEVVVEVAVSDAAGNTILTTDIELTDPDDIAGSQEQAIIAAEQAERIPSDFRLHRTNTIIESDMDGQNEVPVATLHTFARYISGIRVSVDPLQGEYINLLMDGTKTAELDLGLRFQTAINMDGAERAARKDLISKEEMVLLGLESSKQLQTEKHGYAPEEITLKSIEPVYVVSPSDPLKMVLAWDVIDDQMIHVILDARSGEVLYWSN